MGGIAKGIGGLFGGSKPKVQGFDVPYSQEIARGATEGLFRNIGVGGDLGQYFSTGGREGTLDFSQVGAGPTAAEEAEYSARLDPMRQQIASLQDPSLFSATYTPQTYEAAQFNFEGLPEQFASEQFSRGAEDLSRANQSNLAATREALGTRRPDLLFQAEQRAGEQLGRQLGGLRRDIGIEQMRQETDLATQQQLQQAAENMRAAQFGAGEQFRGYQSQADLEQRRAQQGQQSLENLGRLFGTELDLESMLSGRAKEDVDRLLNLFGQTQQIQASGQRQLPGQTGFFQSFGQSAGKTLGGQIL